MPEKTLKPWMINFYAAAVFGFNLMVNMNSAYTTFFLTDIALIPAALVASMLLFVRIGDMVMVPIIGGLIEKSNLKWGKYRSWLLIAPPILSIFYTLIYTNMNLSTTPKIVLWCTVYLLAHVFVNFSYGALFAVIPLMTKDSMERTKISARRIQFQSVASIIFGYIAMPMLLFFTGGNVKVPGSQGFIITTAIFAAIMLITFLMAYKSTEGFEEPVVTDSSQAVIKQDSLKASEMASLMLKNPHLLAVIIGDTCARVVQFGILGLAVYYFRYVLQDMPMLAVFLGNLGIIQLVGSSLVPYIAKIIDKRLIYITGLALMVLTNIAAWMFANSTWSFIILAGLSFVGIAFTHSTSPALFADASDFSEWKTGKNAKGFIMGMGNLSPKIALIFTGTLTSAALAAIGYVANTPATPELVSGIKNLMHFMPAGFAGLGIVAMMLMNKLDRTRMAEIEHDLSKEPMPV